jgi:hypothetical protein
MSLAQSCENKEGRGEIFYEFEKIYIYISHVPSSEYNQEDYPRLLNFENISHAAQNAVKQNFATCLVKNDNSLKSVVVVERPVDEMYKAENLTLVIKVNYYVSRSQKLEQTKNEPNGYIAYSFYRPGVQGSNALPLMTYTSAILPLFPARGEEQLHQDIDRFFSLIEPSGSFKNKGVNMMDFSNVIPSLPEGK